MPKKYKVVATSPVEIRAGALRRRWLTVHAGHQRPSNSLRDASKKIISVCGVLWKDIPRADQMRDRTFGRGIFDLAIRPELTMEDFDVEIVNA